MNLVIEWSYRSKKGTETFFRSEEMPAAQALLIAEDLDKTGRTKHIQFLDQYDSSWTLKELKSYVKGIETEPHNIIVYFDGGFDWETKMAGLGCVIYYEQNGKSFRLRRNLAITGLISNNEAEYAALHLCLQELEILGAHHLPIKVLGDSKVVINHLNEEWPVIEESLYSWANKIEDKMRAMGFQPQYEHVSRKTNSEADRLAAQALANVEVLAIVERA